MTASSQPDLVAIAAALRTRLAALETEIAAIEAERSAPLDADFSEQAAELETADALGGIEASKVNEIAEIHAALTRIANGNYGVCSVCGGDIPPARLAALPAATTCVSCHG